MSALYKKKRETNRVLLLPLFFDILKDVLTFITIPDGIEVDIVRIFSEKHEAEPRLESVNGHNKKYTNDPPLFRRVRIPS